MGCHWSHARARRVGRRRWRAVAADVLAQQGRTGGRDTHPSLAARSELRSCMAPAAAVFGAARSAGHGPLTRMPPITRGAQDDRRRQLAASSSSSSTPLTRRSRMPRWPPRRRCRATAGHVGPVAARSSRPRPSVVSLSVVVVPALCVFLLLYRRVCAWHAHTCITRERPDGTLWNDTRCG